MSVNYIDKSTGDLIRVAGGGNDVLYADSPIGSIIPFGGTTAPDGFLLCQGQAVSRTTYAELFAVIGTSFCSGNGSTTFNIPDLREATTKGVGLSGKSSNHFDSDGVALGEFVEDRLQAHTHSHKIGSSTAGSEEWVMFATSQVLSGMNQTDYGVVGRFGNTTEVKAVGVNYIIKAKQVSAPADLAPVDTVESGNMKAVTSNAVYDALTDSYSTTETKTNKVWIDGKPIYRKVIHYTGVVPSNSAASTVIGSIAGFADIVNFTGTFRNNADGNCFSLNYGYAEFDATGLILKQIMPFVIGNEGNVVVAKSIGFDITNINIVVEYTKA